MEQNPEARFSAFDKDERDALHWAITAAGKRLMEDAEADRIPHDQLLGAASLYLHMSHFALQLDLVAGRPAYDLESAVIVAQLIASGEAPQMAAEVEPRDYSGMRG